MNEIIKRISENFNVVTEENGFEIYLEVYFPILFSYCINNKRYLIYVLDMKQVKRKLEFVIVEVTDVDIYSLLTQQKSIRNTLLNSSANKKNSAYFRRNYNRAIDTYDTYFSTDKQDYIDNLPEFNFNLTDAFPNEINLIHVENNVSKRLNQHL